MKREDMWKLKSKENIEKWGLQKEETILLAMMEELGELSQAWLKYCETGKTDPDKRIRAIEELDDLASLMFQMEEIL